MEVPADALKFIVQNFNITKNVFFENVETIKEWMKTQPHLPEILDEKRIENFLILNKCSVEKTKAKIEMYYKIRQHYFFKNINPKFLDIKAITDMIYFVLFPKMTKDMYRVAVFKIRDKTLIENLVLIDCLRYITNVQEMRLKEDVMYGDIFILDAQDANFKLLCKVTPKLIYTVLVTIYQKVYSCRMKAWYIVNAPPFIEKLLKLLKLIIKPKLFERIHIYSDANILKQHFPEEMLPVDYGGKERSLEELQESTRLKMAEFQNRFDKLDELRAKEG